MEFLFVKLFSQKQYFIVNYGENINQTLFYLIFFFVMVHVPNAFCEHMFRKSWANFITLGFVNVQTVKGEQ
jgi:hypothetical protein